MEIPTDHMTNELAGKNFGTLGSAISTSNSTVVTRTSGLFNKISNNYNFYKIGIILPEETSTQSGIWLGLDP